MRRALLTLLTVAVAGCGEADDGGAGEAPAGEPMTLLERGIVEERPPADEVFSPERSSVP